MPLTWSPLTESNRRPSPYHGDALPTELRGQVLGCLTLHFVTRGPNLGAVQRWYRVILTTDLGELSVSLAHSRLAPCARGPSFGTSRLHRATASSAETLGEEEFADRTLNTAHESGAGDGLHGRDHVSARQRSGVSRHGIRHRSLGRGRCADCFQRGELTGP
jgi:hypothetical protein